MTPEEGFAGRADDPNRPVILIGMMGCGKTTVGRRLASRLGREFIDADKEIEDRCGVPITTIFELEGEDGFRRREALLIDDLTRVGGTVIATGGGAVLRPENRERLAARGFVIYLRATVAELWQRLRRDRVRPLLQTPNPRQRIAELLGEREPLYQQVAHLTVASGRGPVDELVADILKAMPSHLVPAGRADDPA